MISSRFSILILIPNYLNSLEPMQPSNASTLTSAITALTDNQTEPAIYSSSSLGSSTHETELTTNSEQSTLSFNLNKSSSKSGESTLNPIKDQFNGSTNPIIYLNNDSNWIWIVFLIIITIIFIVGVSICFINEQRMAAIKFPDKDQTISLKSGKKMASSTVAKSKSVETNTNTNSKSKDETRSTDSTRSSSQTNLEHSNQSSTKLIPNQVVNDPVNYQTNTGPILTPPYNKQNN